MALLPVHLGTYRSAIAHLQSAAGVTQHTNPAAVQSIMLAQYAHGTGHLPDTAFGVPVLHAAHLALTSPQAPQSFGLVSIT